jgi:lysozyme
MPRIPQRPILKESHISGFQLATPRVADIGVSKARPTRVTGTGENILAGAVKDVSQALGDAADFFAVKEENIRVAKSQHLQMDVNDFFRAMKVEDAKQTSDQTVGMLDRLKEKEEEFRTLNIPDNLDAKTNKELTKQFNNAFTRHAAWTVSHTIQQAGVADAEARIRSVQNARQNIATLNIGDTKGIDQEIEIALNFELERHPNLTENQIETNRRALREDFTTFAITKWAIDNPTAAVSFWDKNQEYIKKAIPKTYNVIAKKIDVAREDANYNTAMLTLQRLYGKDTGGMAKFVDDDIKNQLKLTPMQHLDLSSTLWANHRHKVAEEEKAQEKKEENYLRNSHEKYYNSETRTINVAGAITDLDEKNRTGELSPAFYRAQRNQLLAGIPFSAESSQQLLRDIDDLKVTTTGEVLARVQGTNAPPGMYEAARKQRQAEIVKGFTGNYFNEAEQKYAALAAITKAKDLPSGVSEKVLLLSPIDQPKFRRDLEAQARQAGYTAGDPRILDLADKMLEAGWYGGFSLRAGTAIQEEIFHPGEAPWYILGETYTRRGDMPGDQIATGGSPGPAVAREPIIDPALDKLMRTPEADEAITRLNQENIPVDAISLQQMMDFLSVEGVSESISTPTSTPASASDLISMIKHHEGFKKKPYVDASGMSVGYGHFIKKGEQISEVTEEEAEQILVQDLEIALKDVNLIFSDFSTFSPQRQNALTDMLFNLGRTKFLGTTKIPGFTDMIAAVKKGDWEKAAKEAEDSSWYNQVGKRGVKIVKMLREG